MNQSSEETAKECYAFFMDQEEYNNETNEIIEEFIWIKGVKDYQNMLFDLNQIAGVEKKIIEIEEMIFNLES